MIVVDFKCRKCNQVVEHFLSNRYKESKAMLLCSCGGLMDRQLSAANIHLNDSFPGAKLRRSNETIQCSEEYKD